MVHVLIFITGIVIAVPAWFALIAYRFAPKGKRGHKPLVIRSVTEDSTGWQGGGDD
jgi:hypothetical protein